jgi:ADP-ribose pyrophosphatase YjhB (NUDIX family)
MTFRSPIKHCRDCGTAVAYRLPDDGDTKQRAVCPACHTVHYENPLNVVGTVPEFTDGRVLLCKRNIEPRWGKWTLPAGFMELDETTAQGAARETDEEAGAQIEMGPLFSLLNVRRVGQVHLFYRARLLSDQFNPGYETIEARHCSPKKPKCPGTSLPRPSAQWGIWMDCQGNGLERLGNIHHPGSYFADHDVQLGRGAATLLRTIPGHSG